MNIVVCLKITPDPEDLEVGRDGSISTERAEWTIGSFDLPALEAGVRLVEIHGGKVMALCAGPAEINNSKIKKDILSRGPDELFTIVDESLRHADTAKTAAVLAAAVQKLGQVDLVLFGEGSADLYFQQTGVQVGERLGWVTMNAVSRIEAQENGTLTVQRTLEQEIELLELPLPAALSVTSDIHEPRLASMREILKAGRKPMFEWTLADLGVVDLSETIEILKVEAPPRVARKQVMIEGSPEEAAKALLSYLRKEGVL
jgi:electron transfer flavoprotein beta subunit